MLIYVLLIHLALGCVVVIVPEPVPVFVIDAEPKEALNKTNNQSPVLPLGKFNVTAVTVDVQIIT